MVDDLLILEATWACYQPEQQRLDDSRYLCRHLELPRDLHGTRIAAELPKAMKVTKMDKTTEPPEGN
jgi:hypothetical protein